MFIDAIKKVASYTRAIHSIARYQGSALVIPSAATLFFVNSDGWALTCKHVAQQVLAADQLSLRYAEFKSKSANTALEPHAKQLIRKLQTQYGFTHGELVQLLFRFMNCIEGSLDVDVMYHSELDVALLHFKRFTKLLCDDFPTFAKSDSDLKQGMYICRLGFPFAEFSNFTYDDRNDRIAWTDSGRIDTPSFPVDGMVTRHLVDQNGQMTGFEVSTPGLRGQSGGPAFDSDGRVWGMQYETNHLDLDFDVDIEVIRMGQKRKVHHSAVLQVGHCVHVSVLKAFMRQHKVSYNEG
ncbi:MAG TPA: serine protease [Candidatus Saccharimonadales bacterium]|nr:serine protease [Candidatus Saccharimonadales bacterium]